MDCFADTELCARKDGLDAGTAVCSGLPSLLQDPGILVSTAGIQTCPPCFHCVCVFERERERKREREEESVCIHVYFLKSARMTVAQ